MNESVNEEIAAKAIGRVAGKDLNNHCWKSQSSNSQKRHGVIYRIWVGQVDEHAEHQRQNQEKQGASSPSRVEEASRNPAKKSKANKFPANNRRKGDSFTEEVEGNAGRNCHRGEQSNTLSSGQEKEVGESEDAQADEPFLGSSVFTGRRDSGSAEFEKKVAEIAGGDEKGDHRERLFTVGKGEHFHEVRNVR